MTPREYDESDARIRPSRTTRRRTKDRPTHSDSITAFVTTVDRGRTTCVTDDGVVITAMKARELGPKSVVVGDLVEIVGDVSGTEGSLARIVVVNERTNSLSRTVDDAARVERTIVSNIDQLLIVVASANPEPRRPGRRGPGTSSGGWSRRRPRGWGIAWRGCREPRGGTAARRARSRGGRRSRWSSRHRGDPVQPPRCV